MGENNDHVIAAIDPYNLIVTSIEEKMESLCPLTDECCIYRVPHRLRRSKEKSCIPKVVSIGPLHHGDEGLEKMEEKKMIYLKHFLQRNQVNLKQCLKRVKKGLERLRSCYAEDLGYKENEHELVKIIVVDAVFIIEILLKWSDKGFQDDNDRILDQWILPDIQTEFMLLENQLPFFILEDLWQLETEVSISLTECCFDFFEQCGFLKTTGKYQEPRKVFPKHLLDLLRIFYEPASSTAEGQDRQQHSSCGTQTVLSTLNATCPHEAEDELVLCIPIATRQHEEEDEPVEPVLSIPNATQLHEAGVELKVIKTTNLFNIDFTKGTLKIPELEISDETESILRNLIAFEQCHNCQKKYLSDYTGVMDSIIDTPKDVDLLVQQGIIVNLLGRSDDVCAIINGLGDGVIINYTNNFHYARLFKKVDSYCKTSWHRWKATLKHDYFNTPWAIISFFAAVVLIVLTIIQTACAIIST